MAFKKIHAGLTEFGFDQEEAEIMVFLAAMGPLPARAISRRFEFNRMKTYRTLKSMEEKGMVQRVMGRPAKYLALPLKEMLQDRINDTREKLAEMTKKESIILEEMEKIAGEDLKISEEPRFRFYQGRQQVYELISQMCSNAEKELSIITTSNDLLRLSLWGLEDKLMELGREGKKIQLLTEIDEPNIREIEAIMGNIEVRHLSTEAPVRFIVTDREEVLTSVVMDDSMSMTTQEDTGLWASSPSFASAMKTFYDSMWSVAPDARTVINVIRTGEKPQEFKTIRSKRECDSMFIDMLERCLSNADILVTRLHDLPLPVENMMRLVGDKKLRIVTNLDESKLVMEDESGMHKTRHNVLGSNLLLLFVDDGEVLMSTREWEQIGQAVWSNTTAYVESMRLVFNDYWNRGAPSEEYYIEYRKKQKLTDLAVSIGKELEKSGWSIKIPGLIPGKSGVEYSFTLSGQHSTLPKKYMGLNIVSEDDAFNQIMELSVRRMDLESPMILSSLTPLEKSVEELAKLYGVKLVYGENAGIVANKITEIIKAV